MLKDSEWSSIDSEACLVVDFKPTASVVDGRVIINNKMAPYASVSLKCKKYQQAIEGFITHKVDFTHLWAALKERGLAENEEVIIFWSKKQLKAWAKPFSVFMPKLWVMICPKGAYELMTNPHFMPELGGEARWDAQSPIIDWKPKTMN